MSLNKSRRLRRRHQRLRHPGGQRLGQTAPPPPIDDAACCVVAPLRPRRQRNRGAVAAGQDQPTTALCRDRRPAHRPWFQSPPRPPLSPSALPPWNRGTGGQQRAGRAKAPAASSAPRPATAVPEIGQRQAQKAEGAEQHPAGRHLAQPKPRDTSRPGQSLKPLATITGSINIPASNGVFWCTNCSSWAISSSKPTRVIRTVIAIITPLKIMRCGEQAHIHHRAGRRQLLADKPRLTSPPRRAPPAR